MWNSVSLTKYFFHPHSLNDYTLIQNKQAAQGAETQAASTELSGGAAVGTLLLQGHATSGSPPRSSQNGGRLPLTPPHTAGAVTP